MKAIDHTQTELQANSLGINDSKLAICKLPEVIEERRYKICRHATNYLKIEYVHLGFALNILFVESIRSSMRIDEAFHITIAPRKLVTLNLPFGIWIIKIVYEYEFYHQNQK